MAELKNEFSWSWSRHRAFHQCRRFYWLQHYGFWGGWRRGSPARDIYIQKKLNTRPQWLGTQVHAAAEWTLREVLRGSYPPPATVIARARAHAATMIRDSAAGRYLDDPKRRPGFVEHYYGESVPDEQWEADLDEIGRQIGNLFEHRIFLRLAEVPGQIDEVEELEQVTLDGVPVWVSLDVLVRDAEGRRVVIDWKTGRSHDPETVAQQLGIYGAYVASRYFGVAPEGDVSEIGDRISAIYVNLREGTHEVRPIGAAVIAEAVERVRSSASAMRAALADVAQNVARREDFPMLPEGSAACARCAYRRTCGREGGPAD